MTTKSVTYVVLAAVMAAASCGKEESNPGIDVATAKGGNTGSGGRRATGSGGDTASGTGGTSTPPTVGAGGSGPPPVVGSGGATGSGGSAGSAGDDGGTVPEAAEEAPVAPLCLNTVTAMGNDGLIDNFEDMDASILMRDGRAGSWWLSISPSTTVMGMAAGGPPVAVTGGQMGKALHVQGVDTMSNGWGVSLTASLLPEGKMGCYDVTKYASVRLGLKGKANSKVWVHLMTTPQVPLAEGGMGGHKRFMVTLRPTFQNVIIKFTDFMDGWGTQAPLDITKVFAVDISPVIAEGATDFDFWVDNLAFGP